MSDVGKTLVAGHGLRHEGAPHLVAGCCAAPGNHGVRNTYDREGHGRCACGDFSEHLSDRAARKRWHRKHKAPVVAGAVEGGDGG